MKSVKSKSKKRVALKILEKLKWTTKSGINTQITDLNTNLKQKGDLKMSKFYLHEFKLFDGEATITFNIVDLNEMKTK